MAQRSSENLQKLGGCSRDEKTLSQAAGNRLGTLGCLPLEIRLKIWKILCVDRPLSEYPLYCYDEGYEEAEGEEVEGHVRYKIVYSIDDENVPEIVRRTNDKRLIKTACDDKRSIPDLVWIHSRTHTLKVPLLWAADSKTIFFLEYSFHYFGQEKLGHSIADCAPMTIKSLRMASSHLGFEIQHVLLSTQHIAFNDPETLAFFCRSLPFEHQDSFLSVSLEPGRTFAGYWSSDTTINWADSDLEDWTNAVSWLLPGVRSVIIRLNKEPKIPEQQHRALYMMSKGIREVAPEAMIVIARGSDPPRDREAHKDAPLSDETLANYAATVQDAMTPGPSKGIRAGENRKDQQRRHKGLHSQKRPFQPTVYDKERHLESLSIGQ